MENLNSMQPIMSYDPADFFLFHERKQPFSYFDANFTESFKSHRLVGFLRESTLHCHEPVLGGVNMDLLKIKSSD